MILFEKKYQTFDTVFHHQMKHLEVRQKYSAARRIFNSLLGVSSGDETLHLMFDILLLMLQVHHFQSFSKTLSTVNEHFLSLDDRLPMNVWPSFQQKFSSCSILRDTVYFHHKSIFQSNHFQG